ncbi:hypothetical protein [Massilia sp. UYP11]|uniref:hypothetical protein n=1 Tax=Massilia sp. UYP11 TaxID=1756385 RepID=UPI003D1D4F0A
MNVNDDLNPVNGKLSADEAHCARQRLAQDHAALFPTRLAMARWSGGGLPHLHGGLPALRAAWYARTVRDHQAWLDRGGFAQHDDMIPLRKPTMWHPPKVSLPQGALTVQQQDSHSPTQQNSQSPCRSDRDGDARQCGTYT